MDPEVLMDFNFLSETEWMYKLKERYGKTYIIEISV